MENYIRVSLILVLIFDIIVYSVFAITLGDSLFLWRDNSFMENLGITAFCLLGDLFLFSALCGVSCPMD